MITEAIVAAVVATVLAFMLSAGESAIHRMTRVRAEELHDEGRVGSRALMSVVADPAPYLATMTFLRIIAETATAVFTTAVLVAVTDSIARALILAIAIMAVVSFVVVGVSPRTLGRQHFDRVALLAAPVARGLRFVLGPIAHGLVAFGNAVTPGRGYRDGPFQSESELLDLLDQATERDVIEVDERAMITSVFELGDTVAREVMVPRTDMMTIDRDEPLRKAMSVFLKTGFSRMPVLGEDSDDVVGLLYFKDAVQRVTANPVDRKLPVEVLMRPVAFVPESKPVDDLLRDMQREQSHLAIVIDEYGGTAGLVTIEDIIEEIVGEISDEHDRDEPQVEALADGGYRVPASMNVHDMGELFDLEFDEDEIDTVGGLLTKALGRIPYAGAHAGAHGLSLTAERMAGRRHRIATVIVRSVVPLDERTAAPLVDRLTDSVIEDSTSGEGSAAEREPETVGSTDATDASDATAGTAGTNSTAGTDVTVTAAIPGKAPKHAKAAKRRKKDRP